jgi:hypothetical protein
MNSSLDPDETEPYNALARELAGFRPLPPSADLKRRILEQADANPEQPRLPAFPRWVGIAAALVISLSLGAAWVRSLQPRSMEQGSVGAADADKDAEFVADTGGEVEEETVWVAGELTGIVDTGEGPPMWKLRCETIRRTAWADAEGAAQIRFEPEERLLFIPVSYN